MASLVAGSLPASPIAGAEAGTQAADSGSGPEASLAAEATDSNEVRVNVSSSGSNVSARLVVTHEDELSGTVVDRVANVSLEGDNASVTVEMDGLEPADNRTIRLVNGSEELPRVSNSSQLPNGSRIDEVPSVAAEVVNETTDEEDEGGQQGLERMPVPAYPIEEIHSQRRRGDMLDLVATPTGLLVAAYVEHEPYENRTHAVGTDRPVARVSEDGGQSWSQPIPLRSPVENSSWVWMEGALEQGSTISFVLTHSLDGPGRVGPTHVRLDAAEREVLERKTLGEEWIPDAKIAHLSDGSVLVGEAGANFALTRMAPGSSPETVLEWDPDGNARDVRLATGPAGVGAVLTVGIGDWKVDNYVSWSTDAGQTFSEPERIPSLSNMTVTRPVSADVDAAGALHASFFVPTLVSREEPNNAFHVRLPAGSAEAGPLHWTSHREDAWVPEANNTWLTPTLIADGSRLWMTWDTLRSGGANDLAGSFAIESLDGGRSFSSPYKLDARTSDPAWDGRPRIPVSPAVLPEGRPVALGVIDRDRLVAMPLFHPLADTDTGLTTVLDGADERVRNTTEEDADDNDTREDTDAEPENNETRTSANETRRSGNETRIEDETSGNLTSEAGNESDRPATNPNDTDEAPAPEEPANASGPADNASDRVGGIDRPAPGPGLLAALALLALAALAGRRARRPR